MVYVEPLPGYPAYVPPSAQHLEWELHEGAERAGLQRLWELDRSVRIAGGTVAGAHLRVGEVAKEVVGLAAELEIDLIVVGTRGRGVIGTSSGAACPLRNSIYQPGCSKSVRADSDS